MDAEDEEWMLVDKLWSGNSTQLLQEIDQTMSIMESIFQGSSESLITEEVYQIHKLLLEVSQLLYILQQDPKMKPLAKGLSLQLKHIQEQYNRVCSRREFK